MIAILNTEEEAARLSGDIHNFLLKNRKGYSKHTKKWQDIDKSDSAELWAVVIPKDYNYNENTVEIYPKGWRVAKEEAL